MSKPTLLAAALAATFTLAACTQPETPKDQPATQQQAIPATHADTRSAAYSIKLEMPTDWKAFAEGNNLRLTIPKFNDVVIRPVPGAAVPADALPLVRAAIQDDVLEFKTVTVNDITLAGKHAKHVIGTGLEADDHDPSNTEVFVFTVAGKVYIACVHGEAGFAAELRPKIQKVLDSAKPR